VAHRVKSWTDPQSTNDQSAHPDALRLALDGFLRPGQGSEGRYQKLPTTSWARSRWARHRIDHRPLTLPIAAHLIVSLDVATFHSICPNEVGIDGRKNAFDVPAIEEGIDSS